MQMEKVDKGRWDDKAKVKWGQMWKKRKDTEQSIL